MLFGCKVCAPCDHACCQAGAWLPHSDKESISKHRKLVELRVANYVDFAVTFLSSFPKLQPQRPPSTLLLRSSIPFFEEALSDVF
jgi:hypothetical protein